MILALRDTRPGLWFAARVVLTVAILAILWQAAGGVEILTRLAQASPLWLALSVTMMLLQTILSAQRWRITAAQLGQSLTTRYATREYFLSQAFNQAAPGAVMGDAARAVRARSDGGLMVAAQAVFLERLAGQILMFLTLAIAFAVTLALPGGIDWPPALRASLTLAIGAGIATALVLFALPHLPGAAARRAASWLAPLTRALLAPRVLPAQIALGLPILACNLAAFGFAAEAVGVTLSPAEILTLTPAILFAMLVPFTISGWGIREGAAALILPLAGVAVTDAVAASILFGLALILSVLPGALMVVTR